MKRNESDEKKEFNENILKLIEKAEDFKYRLIDLEDVLADILEEEMKVNSVEVNISYEGRDIIIQMDLVVPDDLVNTFSDLNRFHSKLAKEIEELFKGVNVRIVDISWSIHNEVYDDFYNCKIEFVRKKRGD